MALGLFLDCLVKHAARMFKSETLVLAVVSLQLPVFVDIQDGYDSKLQLHLGYGCYRINIDMF